MVPTAVYATLSPLSLDHNYYKQQLGSPVVCANAVVSVDYLDWRTWMVSTIH